MNAITTSKPAQSKRYSIRTKNKYTYCTSYTVHLNGRVIASFHSKAAAIECRNRCNENACQ